MNLQERAQRAHDTICEIYGLDPKGEKAEEARGAIERAIIEAVLAESQRCISVARACCSPDLDIAHKIARRIESANTALIANLSSLR